MWVSVAVLSAKSCTCAWMVTGPLVRPLMSTALAVQALPATTAVAVTVWVPSLKVMVTVWPFCTFCVVPLTTSAWSSDALTRSSPATGEPMAMAGGDVLTP